jgi:hypothetical protein
LINTLCCGTDISWQLAGDLPILGELVHGLESSHFEKLVKGYGRKHRSQHARNLNGQIFFSYYAVQAACIIPTMLETGKTGPDSRVLTQIVFLLIASAVPISARAPFRCRAQTCARAEKPAESMQPTSISRAWGLWS